MKINRLLKMVTVLGLAAFANISCASEPQRDTSTKPVTTAPPSDATTATHPPKPLPDQAISFKVTEKGGFIPVNKDGKEFVSCGTLEKNSCAPFNNKVTLTGLQFTAIAKMDFQVNPTCQLYMVIFEGQVILYYDPFDPNCPKFNR